MRSSHWIIAAAFCLSVLGLPRASQAATTLRIATLAPKSSAWGKSFEQLKRSVEKRTDGALKIEIYYNAVQGDETAMVSKLKSGQLDGAALTSVGLARIYNDVLVLQLPGVLDNWSLLDKARKELDGELRAGFTKEGITLLSWGDLGRVRQMSQGFAIRKPSDMKGKSPAVYRGEPMAPLIYSLIGGVTPKPLGPTEFLPGLRAKTINVVNAPPLAAEQMQWASMLDHISAQSTVCAVGASVIRTDSLEGLDADSKKVFLRAQKRYGERGAKRVRQADDEAYARLQKRMTRVDLNDAEKAEWKQLLKEAVKRLGEGTFSPELVKRVVKIGNK